MIYSDYKKRHGSIKTRIREPSIQNNFLLVTDRERVRCLTGGGKEGLNVSDCGSYLK